MSGVDAMPAPGTLVIIPTYNELENLAAVVGGVLGAVCDAEILVVDDASPDGTGRLAERLTRTGPVHVIHRSSKLGLGSAYRTGFAWGLGGTHQRFAIMDADGSHDPQALPALLVASELADVVVGSRYVPGGTIRDWSLHRRALSLAANRYATALTGVPLRDATSGFRVFHRSVLEAIDVTRLRSQGYAFQIETVVQAHRAGFVTREVPIVFRERGQGRSKLSRSVVAEAMWRVPTWALGRRCRPPGAHRASVASRRGRERRPGSL
jgi:dolichol-phosphate mannosyltransferase